MEIFNLKPYVRLFTVKETDIELDLKNRFKLWALTLNVERLIHLRVYVRKHFVTYKSDRHNKYPF